jgi:hypothetical protein
MGRFQISKWHTLIHSRLGCRELLGLGGMWWDLAGLGFGGALLIQMANLGQPRPRFQIPNFKLKLTAGFGFGIWIWIRCAMDLDQSFGFGYDVRWIWINRGGGAYRIHPIQPGPAVTRYPGNFKFQICDFKFQSGTSRLQIAISNCARNTPRARIIPGNARSNRGHSHRPLKVALINVTNDLGSARL